MREKIASAIDLSYIQLTIIFIILVLLHQLDIFPAKFDYKIFIYILPFLAIPALIFINKSPGTLPVKWILPILLVAFIIAVIIRFIPYFHNSVPLGYDPGFYKYTMEFYTNSLPQIPEDELAPWIKRMYPQGLFVHHDIMHSIVGISAGQSINYFFIFLGAFLVFPIYLVTSNAFGKRTGLLAALLYSVSYTQFEVLNLCYYKNVLGLLFLLLSIYSLQREKYGFMAVASAGLGIFHRPELLLFALVLIPYFLTHRKKGILLGIIGAAILVAPFWIPRIEGNWRIVTGVISNANLNEQEGLAREGGTFFGLSVYSKVALAYIPFAVIGFVHMIIKRNWNIIFFYFLVSSTIVVFKILFFRRLIIPLDIAMIIMAAHCIEVTILQRTELPKIGLAIAAILIIVTAGTISFDYAQDAKPLINNNQLEAAKWVRENTEEDAYVVASSPDAPWVLGWSERKIIAPGLFEWNQNSKDEWRQFILTTDVDFITGFLDTYEGPVYIYSSRTRRSDLNIQRFDEEHFINVYSNDAVVFKYLGGT